MIEATLTLLSLRFSSTYTFLRILLIIDIISILIHIMTETELPFSVFIVVIISIHTFLLIIHILLPILHRWFPPGERTRATGVVIATQVSTYCPRRRLPHRFHCHTDGGTSCPGNALPQDCPGFVKILLKIERLHQYHLYQEPEVELAKNCSNRDQDLTTTMKAQVDLPR